MLTESDDTVTTVEETITPLGASTNVSVTRAIHSIKAVVNNNIVYLIINGDKVIEMNDFDDVHVSSSEKVAYQNNIIYSNTHLDNINTLFYCDEFRVYKFHSFKINPIQGPGWLFYNYNKSIAVFFTASNFLFKSVVTQLESVIHADSSGNNGEDSNDGSTSDGSGYLITTQRRGVEQSLPYTDSGPTTAPESSKQHKESPTSEGSGDPALEDFPQQQRNAEKDNSGSGTLYMITN